MADRSLHAGLSKGVHARSCVLRFMPIFDQDVKEFVQQGETHEQRESKLVRGLYGPAAPFPANRGTPRTASTSRVWRSMLPTSRCKRGREAEGRRAPRAQGPKGPGTRAELGGTAPGMLEASFRSCSGPSKKTRRQNKSSTGSTDYSFFLKRSGRRSKLRPILVQS